MARTRKTNREALEEKIEKAEADVWSQRRKSMTRQQQI